MISKKLSWLVVGLVVLSLLVTGCQQLQPTPEAAEAPAAAGERLCDGVKIVFFPGYRSQTAPG